MNSKERVLTSLNFQRPDRIGINDHFWPEYVQNWRKEKNTDANIYDVYKMDMVVHVCDESFFPTKAGLIKKEAGYDYMNDGWGRIVKQKQGGFFSEMVESVMKDGDDPAKLNFDPADLEQRYPKFLSDVKKDVEREKAVFLKIGGPFIRSTFIRGEEAFLMDLAGDPEFSKALVNKVGEHLLNIGLVELKKTGLYDTGVWIFDDMASNSNLMFSPQVFEDIFMPVYKKIVGGLKKAGAKKIYFHSDGNINLALPMLIEAGIDGINPVEPKAGMDVVAIRKKYGKKLSMIGGVDNAFILPRGNKKEIEEHIMPIIETGREGGVVIGVHSIAPDVSFETYDYYYKLVMEKGKYS